MTEHTPAGDLAAYALGALPPAELGAAYGHLRTGCEPCRREVRAFGEVVALLPYSVVSATPPPARLRERVLALARRPRGAARSLTFALAASLLLAASLGALWLGARGEARAERDRAAALASELTESRDEAARLTARAASLEKETAWLRDPRVQVAILNGLADAKTARARLVWHPEERRGILYADGLPPLPLTKSYELWAFVESTPKPAGVFEVASDGRAVFALDRVEDLASAPRKFAVSVEPKGGVPAPTGSIVLLGETF